MLDSLPPEIIEQILGGLPTALSIVNVARVNRKLHTIVSANNYGIFRDFVKNAFPSISTPPVWRDIACALTSRSRAWDRRSFVARECHPSGAGENHTGRTTYQKFGYIPVIDSYEHWPGDSISSAKQVLAFGAGGRLRLRFKEHHHTHWKSLRLPEDHLQQNDIVDVRLLRPHQHHNAHGETVVVRKANGEVLKIVTGVGADNFTETSRYVIDGTQVDCLDVSMSSNPMLAICNTKSLQVFPVSVDEEIVRPDSNCAFTSEFQFKHRKRCIKFLDRDTVATGLQFLEGRERAPIHIYNITPTGPRNPHIEPDVAVHLDHAPTGRHCANVIANLESASAPANRSGQVFLSGWTDGITRLHDLRTPSQVIAQYVDPVDDGQILSIAAIGNESFFAGSHQNACLKFFDMRMPGARPYSEMKLPQPSPSRSRDANRVLPQLVPRREINIFLALTIQRTHVWAPLSRRQNNTNLPRYRGSIYSLSTPSQSSPTLFAGIENHVIQLDFVNTDDILHRRGGLCDPTAGLSSITSTPGVSDVLNLSCYERPREGHETTDTVLLRKQVDWPEVTTGIDEAQYGPVEDGWDHRWRLARSWKPEHRGQRWRRGSRS